MHRGKSKKEHTEMKELFCYAGRITEEFKNLVSKLSVMFYFLYNIKGWERSSRRVQFWLIPRDGTHEMKMIFSLILMKEKNRISKCGELLFTFLSKQGY